MQNRLVTIFSDIKNVSEPHYITLETALERIKNGKSKVKVNALRAVDDKEERNRLKAELPCVCFGGTFKSRRESDMDKASGLLILDFDNVDNLMELKESLCKLPYIVACWYSPSGNGVKALVHISSPDKYKQHFLALTKEFPMVDQSGKDIVRVCFESFDSDLYVNYKAEKYVNLVEVRYEAQRVSKITVKTDISEIYDNIKKWLNKDGAVFAEGSRNNYITRLTAACNRFGISESDCFQMIDRDFLGKDSGFTVKEAERVVGGIYRRFKDSHSTAEFKDEKVVNQKGKKEIHIKDLAEESDDGEPKDAIYLEDIKEDLERDFLYGTSKGLSTGFSGLDNHFRWAKGELTTLVGVGNYGKSSMLAQLCLIQAIHNGSKFAFFSPEQFPSVYFYKDLIRSYIGKPTDNYAPDKMSLEEFRRGQDFISKHFFFIYPQTASPTPEYIAERLLEQVIKNKVDGIVIDPFGSLEESFSSGARPDIKLNSILRSFKKIAMDNNLYFWIVAHPVKLQLEPNGEYRQPRAYDISGGGSFSNCCDNILSFHRPNYQNSPTDPTCILTSMKIKKQMLNGVPGTATFTYDRSRGRYYENGLNPFDEKIEVEVRAISPIQPNLSFYETEREEPIIINSEESPF